MQKARQGSLWCHKVPPQFSVFVYVQQPRAYALLQVRTLFFVFAFAFAFAMFFYAYLLTEQNRLLSAKIEQLSPKQAATEAGHNMDLTAISSLTLSMGYTTVHMPRARQSTSCCQRLQPWFSWRVPVQQPHMSLYCGSVFGRLRCKRHWPVQ